MAPPQRLAVGLAPWFPPTGLEFSAIHVHDEHTKRTAEEQLLRCCKDADPFEWLKLRGVGYFVLR